MLWLWHHLWIGSLFEKLHALLFGLQYWQVKQLSISSCMKINALRGLMKGMLEEDSGENAKEGWSKDTTLLHSAVNIKCLRCQSLLHDGPLHLVMEDFTTLRSVSGQPILLRILNRLSLLTRSKAFFRSIKAMYSSFSCSLHFSWSCLSDKPYWQSICWL